MAGHWNELTEELWSETTEEFKRAGRTYVVGAEIYINPKQYKNVMIFRGKYSWQAAQRIPVPISMWKPFKKEGAVPDWFGSGVIGFDDNRAAVLLCYEPFLIWPIALSMLHDPDIILCPSNSWWSRDTVLPRMSDQYAEGWARLFGKKLVIAKNI